MSPIKTLNVFGSWKSDGSVLSNNDGLVGIAASVGDREGLGHANPGITPNCVVSTEGSLASAVLLSEFFGHVD